MASFSVPPFQPHPLVRGGHAQTLAAYFWSGSHAYRAKPHRLTLDDGDIVVLHDDCPPAWKPGDRIVLFLSGLAGCHHSAYLVRTAEKLNVQGVRTFRMDHRGWGAGAGLAQHPFHAGRSGDVLAAARFLSELCPGSPLAVVGFSLSGNVVLKALGELRDELPRSLDKAAALTPPVNLSACADWMERPANRFYNRHLVGCLLQHLKDNRRPFSANGQAVKRPKTLRVFDDLFTAPAAGFLSVEDYYTKSSSAQFLHRIEVSTLIIAAADDPMIPVRSLSDLKTSPLVQLHIATSGGHLGFIGRPGPDPDRRWLDWRIVDWILAD